MANWDATNTVARTFTATVSGGDMILTGSIAAAQGTGGINHRLTKSGLGTLTIQGVASTLTGAVTLSSIDASATTGKSGTTFITDFRSLGTSSSGVINLGNATTTTGSLTIGVDGITPTALGLQTSRVININTTTKPVTITYLDAAGTVDEHIARVVQSKQRLIRTVVDDDHANAETMATVREVIEKLTS